VTDSITTFAAASTVRPHLAKHAETQQAATEAPVQGKEARTRLLQAGQLAQAARSAAHMQIARCNQLGVEGLGGVDPPRAEILQNPELLEDFKCRKQREANLVAGTQHAFSKSERTQTELSRALAFLMPQLRPGEQDDGISLPGFESPMKDPSSLDTSGLIWDSHNDFYAQISALLGVLQTEWLSKYQDALGKFLEFYQKFSDIMEMLKPEATGDKGDIVIKFAEVHAKLKRLEEDYGLDVNALASFPTKAAAEAFKASLGLPGLTITGPSSDGQFHVKMDLSAIKDIRRSMWNTIPDDSSQEGTPWPDGEKMDSAKYNAWVSAKDSNMEQIKHVSKVLGEKLSEMTQKFDNIVKILSSTIDKISEADKSFVNDL
jgi:type III secretion system IpaD/SipD/SspD family effector